MSNVEAIPKTKNTSDEISSQNDEIPSLDVDCQSSGASNLKDNGESGGSGDKITLWQAAWNTTNAIQGMFLVALPYTVLHGGYWAIIAMIGVACICCYTGKILVECLYELDSNGVVVRVRDRYMAIAKVCLGARFRSKVVILAQCIQLLSTCTLYIVLFGYLMVAIFRTCPMDSRSWMMLCGMLLIPCAFLKNRHQVSKLSFGCPLAHILISLFVVAYCLSYLGQWGFGAVSFTLDLETFPISLGIITFSYTSHIFLPTLEGNMMEPQKFSKMLNWSHIAAAVFKSGFAYVAFLTWQSSTMQVITNNLPKFWKAIVNCILLLTALFSYPLPYYTCVELLERVLFSHATAYKVWDKEMMLTNMGFIFRMLVILITILLAIGIPHFSILMGFVGNFTGTMIGFIWPCYFHLKLKGDQLAWPVVALDCFIIFLGCSFAVIGIYDSGTAMMEAFSLGLLM